MTQRTCLSQPLRARETVACDGCRFGSLPAGWPYLIRATLLCLAACSGCSMLKGLDDQIRYNDGTYQVTTRLQSCYLAHCAWHQRAARFREVPHPHDLAAGFRQGYCDVANGEEGCPPPLAPRKYWGSRFETPTGQHRIAAWFAGYSYGATAAEEEAAGVFRPVYVSPEIQRQYERQLAKRQDSGGRTREAGSAGVAEPDLSPKSGPSPESPTPNPDSKPQPGGLPSDKPGLPSDKPGLPSDKPGLPSDAAGLPSAEPGIPSDAAKTATAFESLSPALMWQIGRAHV